MKKITTFGLSLILLNWLVACNQQSAEENVQSETSSAVDTNSAEFISEVTSAVDDATLQAAAGNDRDWLSYGRGYDEQRYSQLTQVNQDNVGELGLAWALELGDDVTRGIQATPIVVDGIMYMTGPWSMVWAIDTRTGQKIWTYDPKVPRTITRKLCCGVNNRGVALYKGAVYFGTVDGRLIALDAVDGSLKWSVETVPQDSYYSITGAARVFDGKVIIGNGGAEFIARGFVSAYDAETGELDWRFYTVPGNPADGFEHPDLAEAAKTWTGEWWEQGGGGTAWDSIVYDPSLGLVYIGVGNGAHWDREIRSPDGGDNLYLSSIVAVDVKTGEYRWHFQTTPGDTWDYTATQSIILADLEIDGAPRKVLMQAPKNGFFYVIDRVTGEFISGDNYVYVNWASGLDENGRPIETENARYLDGRVHWIAPSSHGGHNVFPMSYSQQTGLVYIPGVKQVGPYMHVKGMKYGDLDMVGGKMGMGVSFGLKFYKEQVVDPKASLPGRDSGRLIAWDPIKQEEAWGVDMPYIYNGGVLSTAGGLVMQGDAEGNFIVRDAATGEALKSINIGTGIIGTPITYLVDGEQFISLGVNWGGGRGGTFKHKGTSLAPGTIYTWKLGGTAAMPERQVEPERPFTQLTTDATPVEIGQGYNVFLDHCMGCHALGKGGGGNPDLTRSPEGIFAIYPQILLEGALSPKGMPTFGDIMTAQQADVLRSYIIHHASQLREGVAHGELMKQLAGFQKLADEAKQN